MTVDFRPMHEAQRKVLLMRWRWVMPRLVVADTRPWWKKLLNLDAPHQHHHEMTFPDVENDPFGWLFTCKCGHTTTNIEEATP